MHTTHSASHALPTTHKLRWIRLDLNESQTEFWSRFGVTQSQGSRFEKGMGMPSSLTILLSLYLDLKVSDEDLLQARTRVLELETKCNASAIPIRPER